MDNANKILDVTYGSFSCRLEGFEDSVETMKTVVSYFHDLAGHDRFMDMEPQAPDMDTLARLTEEQSNTAVEIEGEGQSVSLRAVVADAAVGALQDDGDVAEADKEEVAQNLSPTEETELAEENDPLEEEAAEDSVADKLRRIRDVVDRGPVEETKEVYAEDEVNPEEAPADTDPLSQRLSVLAAQVAEAVPEDAADPEDDLVAQDDAEILEDDEAANPAAAEAEAVEEAPEDTPVSDTAEDTADEVEAVVEDTIAEVEAADDFEEEVEEAATAPEINTVTEADVQREAEKAVDDVEPLEDAAVAESAGDQISEPEAEPEQATEEVPEAAEAGPLVLTAQDVASKTKANDDDDDDFDLQAEVAKVAAELAARKGNELARHGLPRSVDDAMSRILSQTDQHLNQPESRRHRDAFAQLKAAVAATEAARQLGDEGAGAKGAGDAFKDDLGAHDAEERSQTPPPSAPPLKLVKTVVLEETPEEIANYVEQTAEEPPAPAPATAQEAPTSKPVDAASQRLRQIAARKETPEDATSGDGFREFATKQGAAETIDLIEAAAAYLYYVEAEDDFSRPQVMKKVQVATGKEISREDGLRAFGRLLRLAKIVKLSNGRFRISDSSDYRPDDAQAAQG
jgi:hypothetical protein